VNRNQLWLEGRRQLSRLGTRHCPLVRPLRKYPVLSILFRMNNGVPPQSPTLLGDSPPANDPPQTPGFDDARFFTDPDGDFILRTSDGKEIKVLRAILSRASEFFKSMFNIPQPSTNSSEASTSPPSLVLSKGSSDLSVTIAESCLRMSLLLRLIYPVASPDFLPDLSSQDIFRLLGTAEKYALVPAIDALKALLGQKKFIDKDPVRVYAIARQFGYKDLARWAAQVTLRVGLVGCDVSSPHSGALNGEEYDGFLARDYVRLTSYHQSVASRAANVLSSYRLTSASACTTCQAWGCCWWPAFRTRALEAVQARPHDSAIWGTDFLVQAIINGECENRWMSAFSGNTRLVMNAIKTKIFAGDTVDVFGEPLLD
jgi:hypothetical protein